MCSPATCRTCNKVTFSGCGQHVAQVMQSVPRNQRCSCDNGQPAKRTMFGWGAKK